jgi:hypothetical protein
MQQLHPDLQHLLPYAQQLHPYVQFQQQQYTQQQHQIQQQQFQQPLNIPKEDKSLQVHFLCEQNSEELNNQILLAFREKLTNKLSRGQEYTVVKLFETLYPEWRGLKSEKRKTFFDPFKIHLNLFMKLDEKKTITFYSHYSYRYYRLT